MKFVAFLRNVNLGQPGSPGRGQFEAAFVQSGASSAISFMSNGTLVFTAADERVAGSIALSASEALRSAVGMKEPVFVCGFQHLADLVAADPFLDWGEVEVAERAISFFDYPGEMPVRAPIQSERGDCLVFRIDSGEAFAITREVGGKTGYPTPVLEQALGVPVTTRGWNTLLRLVKKHGENPL